MSEVSFKSSSSQELESYLLLAKSAKGAACVQLIKEVLAAPNIYVFSEVLRMPNVSALSQQPETAQFFSLLELFSYGTYKDYKEHASNLPELTEPQLKKLKLLSIVSLAGEKHVLNYADLLQYFDISNVRELEDLIIDAIYKGLIKAKLDQKKNQVEIEYTMGRDLRPGQLDQMLQILSAWSSTSSDILRSIDEKIIEIREASQATAQAQEEYENKVERITSDIKNSSRNFKANEASDNRMAIDQFKSAEYSEEISRNRLSKRRFFTGRR
ncbi:COP9 constitutive photomorphogenic-like protein subunit 7B-like protein [Basidiobolus meristosporus CBS 931.73]|uniref:COP9 constitutive photomorphogenic-like protein subunit 7B-like protein n=1 Tax=Basidiobolus meristosporus CBS 931.73 TaxID=1314790 RepID=A0A1Y1Z9Y4_9FUNG|nr:COP9 constitutive photomorphogenic-like protein subunit 7B-like protein [Basidiobolus meristosporus CBS 931.73]|eukprot:ORY07088.1 COP9 constitutive photomorphogenic-like protein subunit 7B-like protein [Basidiobolus meristosporus CBS 931.73]